MSAKSSASSAAEDHIDAETHIAFHSVSVDFAGHPQVLAGVDVAVPAGQFVSLIGPSGCGKTTMLRLAAGLEKPTTGRVVVQGAPRIAYVFQEPNLLPVRAPWREIFACPSNC